MEVAMATRNASKQAGALARARDRRRALDRARDEQDQRIEEAVAIAIVALEVRSDVERSLESATSKVGEALKLLIAEDVSLDRAAALLELDVSEVRRLVKSAPIHGGESDARAHSGAKATVAVLPDAAGRDGAARRVG
jgi:DNA-directed RNA polymerase specialized sigma24 family protein